MKIGAAVVITAIVVIVLVGAGAPCQSESDAESAPPESPGIVVWLKKAKKTDVPGFSGSNQDDSDGSKIQEAIDEARIFGEAVQCTGDATYDFVRWMERAYENLQNISTELEKADVELNISKIMQNSKEAWLCVIETTQLVFEIGGLSGKIMAAIDILMQKANDLTKEISVRAINKAFDALATAKETQHSTSKRLLCAIEAVEDAEVVGNIEACRKNEKFILLASRILQESTELIVVLILENASNQENSEMERFYVIMDIFKRAVCAFDLTRPAIIRLFRLLVRSIGFLEQEVSEIGHEVVIMDVPASRILGAMRKTVYGTLRGVDLSAAAHNEDIMALIAGFDSTLIDAWDTMKSKGEVAVYAELLLREVMDRKIDESAAMGNIYKVQEMNRIVNTIKKIFDTMKEKKHAVKQKFNEMLHMIVEEKQVQALGGKYRISKNRIIRDPEPGIFWDLYLLERSIANHRVRIMKIMMYNHISTEQKIANLERDVIANVQSIRDKQRDEQPLSCPEA